MFTVAVPHASANGGTIRARSDSLPDPDPKQQYIYIYMYTYICICICMYIYIYIYIHICIYVYMYVYTYIHISMYEENKPNTFLKTLNNHQTQTLLLEPLRCAQKADVTSWRGRARGKSDLRSLLYMYIHIYIYIYTHIHIHYIYIYNVHMVFADGSLKG